ncbi:MAG: T9SS type A sorting domain-containing protein [Cyclobacteriaceae bacterium]
MKGLFTLFITGLLSLHLVAQNNLSNLKITELHYNPADEIIGSDTIDGDDYEFIEFKNIGSETLDISGVQLDSGIQFMIPANTLLEPGAYYVIADKPSKFEDRYGVPPNGNFSSNLSNKGERIVVTSNGSIIIDFEYSDGDPWPENADGKGYSLMSVSSNPTGDPEDPMYWMASPNFHGSPYEYIRIITSTTSPFITINVYPNPTTGQLNIDLPASMQSAMLNISSVSGKGIIQQQFKKSINLRLDELNIDSGIYFLKLTTADHFLERKIIYSRQ